MNINLRERIENNYFHLTNAQKLIADTIKSYEGKVFDLKLTELAKKSYCSNATITKFIQIFGYTSYKVFQNDLNVFESETSLGILESIKLVDNYFSTNIEIIKNLINSISKAEKIYLFASGQSQISALDFSYKFNKLHPKKCIFEANANTQEILINTLSSKDLVIFISNSGESRELLRFIKDINVEEIYLITNRPDSSLSKRIQKTISLNNRIEPYFQFKEFSRESKYSLIYFFDRLFEELYNK